MRAGDAGSTVRKSSVITLMVSTGVPEVVATPEPVEPTVNGDGTITVQESWWPSADGLPDPSADRRYHMERTASGATHRATPLPDVGSRWPYITKGIGGFYYVEDDGRHRRVQGARHLSQARHHAGSGRQRHPVRRRHNDR